MKYGDGFLLVYSIESRQSFNELEIFYQQILRMKDSESFPMIIVGTKCDLEYQRQVPSSGRSDLNVTAWRLTRLIRVSFFPYSQRRGISPGD
jgi:GTPase SAR1 family protein